MPANGFSFHVSRSELATFEFGDCADCKETVIWGRVKKTQKDQPLNPKPTGGTEIDPTYSLHQCPKKN